MGKTFTFKAVCDEIADELNRQGIVITNKVTGVTVKTGEDVFNFSSRGELFHIWEWYLALFGPEKYRETFGGDYAP